MISKISQPCLKGFRFPRSLISYAVWRNHRFALSLRDCPVPADKWHLDEIVISIRGRKHWLWRAVDATGYVLDILMQSRINAQATMYLLMKSMK
jgi:putative transposase